MPSYKTKKQMKETNKQLEKLRIGSCTKSVRNDLKKTGNMIFSEESSRATCEMGRLFELTTTSL